ncbi:OX-2 membrane glycoprotein-like isoform X3 [Thunnus albacares]|uniref:OX-2 membrane glycoprotein-like isoform X3 n=1 Tax=Thunnus albacares TaxID=8236 RepID=UPI001CF617F9|nr:OX-2 membrane glycoprotein-like isoform X3 [Thunnus albacares]
MYVICRTISILVMVMLMILTLRVNVWVTLQEDTEPSQTNGVKREKGRTDRRTWTLCELSWKIRQGLTAVIQTQQTVMAAVGEDVHLSCQLMQSRDVLQVTWQKLSPDGKKKDIGSYNKYFGETVNDGFQGKVEFKDAGLQNCSIVIRKVMEQDEGCYLCLFNTYPEGSLTGRTCLQLYELHEPILQIRESNSTEETVVSCSATGRPAPTVTLNVTQQDLYFSHNSTVSVTNTNGTVTVTTTAVLSGFHGNGALVGCTARLLSVPEIQVFKKIPAVKPSPTDGSTVIIVFVVLACGCVAAVIAVLLKRKYSNR